MDKYDTSQLTEFPRFEPESSQRGVSTFFNKLWKFPIFTPTENAEGSQSKNNEDDKNPENSEASNRRVSEDVKTEFGSYASELEGRSLPNVLRRISNLIALGSGGGTRYADTELARYWMPDDISRECYECAARFSTLRRRHHCRVCGQIFCSRCCSQRVPGHIFGCAGGLRVCNYCCNVVLSYLNENDLNGEISADLKTLQENLQVKFPDNKDKKSMPRDNFAFARDQEELSDNRSSSNEAVQDIFRQMTHALPTQQHRYRLIRYSGVWRGADILQWVMDNTINKTRIQANIICQNLLSSGYLECVTEVSHFADYALYRPIALPRERDEDIDNIEQSEESSRITESVSSYCLDLNVGDSSARLIKTPKADIEPPKTPVTEDSPVIEHSEGDTESKPVCKAIADWGAEHLRLLMRQSLAREGLSESWLDILLPLCEQAAEIIMPEPDSNDIDVRNYVQVKKVPGGTPRDSCLINGVVLTKNVAHRGMPQQISNPTILLLDCSIAYQRVEGKLTSLEPMLLQEQEHLARSVSRLWSLGAGVALARGGAGRAVVCGCAAAGGALALRVRTAALRRAARATQADLLASLDARVKPPKLGTAKQFYVKNFGSKTLMVFEGCANPHLGCCILLRGASLPELVRVKKVVKFMLLAFYNWKLEKAFYADMEVVLPEPGVAFQDDDENGSQKDFLADAEGMTDSFPRTEDSTNEGGDVLDPKKDVDDDSKIEVKNEDNNDPKFDSSKNQAGDRSHEDESNKDETIKSTEMLDDPLHKPKYSRKTENLSCGVPIRDFSDPLRSTLSVEDEVFLPKEETTLVADTQKERWWSDDVLVCMSPAVRCGAPYLESECGRAAAARRCFPDPLLPAPPPAPRPHPHPPHQPHAPKQPLHTQEYHPFVRMAMTAPADDISVRTSLAHYRATGNNANKNQHKRTCLQYKQSIVRRVKEKEDESKDKPEEPLDPYAPENHQKLHLLLYSYSNKSANVPDFCVNPWIMTMEAYGRHDISLGAFLDKYCFNPQLACSSNNCQVPVNQHVRKFVHGDVCITITCNTIGHSNVDKLKEEQNKQISVWWRCEECGCSSRGRRLSSASARLSLAVYVRGRCAAARRPMRTRTCPHAPHTHTHAFQRGLTTAAFRYSKISFHEIVLPPDVITTIYDTKQMRDALIQQLNELMLKGHETFSCVTDAEREQQQFRQHMEALHVALSAPALSQSSTDVIVRSLWSISDGVIFAEKMLRDVQEKWSSPPAKAKQAQETTADEKTELEDAAIEENNGTTYVFTSDSNKDSDKEHIGQDEDEEKGDKKTIRQILSQLLSSNQSANQGGMLACGGAVPVVVLAHQTGSAIAAALAAPVTRRHVRHKHSNIPEQEETETSSSSKDKTDGDKSKTAKCNEHVEVLLKDGLVCRVYYAAQFQALRHTVIAPLSPDEECCCDDDKKLCSIEEGFIRSLAHCVPWATRGGKSGSTFCKTKDDRYVLKEMTKPEWQQFLEFAPHYFNYVMSCRQNNTPSVLARMVGVYSVCGAGGGSGGGAGVLVLENVWYRAPAQRYDLKGAARHRLAPLLPHHHNVLMDENLLNLRWERALFVRSACARALWRCLERDTRFLASHDVMDYSLLLAHDQHTIVLGIVDYIRTFTWDKKLEHLVKKNLGSGQPTVVSPEEYKGRFCNAAKKYFLQCPEHWDHLYDVIF